MKKVILFVTILIFGTTMFSCKKDYTCKCTKTYTTSTSTYTVDDGNYTYKDTKPRAIDRCDDNDRTSSDLVGEYTRNCDIQ